jgi:hypothetical protein
MPAVANRLPSLDSLAFSRFSFRSSYLFYAGIAILIFFVLEANRADPRKATLVITRN